MGPYTFDRHSILVLPDTPWNQTITETVRDIRIRASIRKNEDYAEAQMGFSDRGDITGEIKSSNETVLSVSGIPNETDTLKLRGKNFSTFNGQEWTDEDISSSPDSMFDTIGIIASLADYDDRMRDYVRWEKMRIEYIHPKDHVRIPDDRKNPGQNQQPEGYPDY